MTPEVAQEISILRQKVNTNTHTVEEFRRVIELLRKSRGIAAAASAKSKASKAPVDSDKLLDELGGLGL